MVSENKVANF